MGVAGRAGAETAGRRGRRGLGRGQRRGWAAPPGIGIEMNGPDQGIVGIFTTQFKVSSKAIKPGATCIVIQVENLEAPGGLATERRGAFTDNQPGADRRPVIIILPLCPVIAAYSELLVARCAKTQLP